MTLRTSLITALAAFSLTEGCSPATKITETAWVASPDGQWLARIARYDTAGPGVSGLYETVQLKRRTANKTADVLTLDEGSLTAAQLSGPPVIAMCWDDAHHLVIKFRAGQAMYQLPRVADVFVSSGS